PALVAASAAEAGADLAGVLAAASGAIARTTTLFYVDTLEFLRRGGRIGASSALVGTALAVKPSLHVYAGAPVARDRRRTVYPVPPRRHPARPVSPPRHPPDEAPRKRLADLFPPHPPHPTAAPPLPAVTPVPGPRSDASPPADVDALAADALDMAGSEVDSGT